MPQTHMPRTAAATRVTPEKWAAARAAVREASERFADLILSVPDSSAMATKDWSVADTAAHVTAIAWNYTAVVAEGRKPFPIPSIRPSMPTTTLDTLYTQNAVQLRNYTERDMARLAEQLRDSITEILNTTADAAPEHIVTWLGGSRLPLAGVLVHMLNELLIHGWDIARAVGVPWRIAEDQAALFFDLFLVELARNSVGHLLDNRPVRPEHIAVEFRSAYTAPVTMVLNSGEASVEEPSGDCDVHIRFRPAALNLVLWHRMGHLQAALTGSLVVWGRRPWLLPAFLRKLRMP